jgi:hypothetical protein
MRQLAGKRGRYEFWLIEAADLALCLLAQSSGLKLPAASCGVFGEGESSRTANVSLSWRGSLCEPAFFVKVRRVCTRSRREATYRTLKHENVPGLVTDKP